MKKSIFLAALVAALMMLPACTKKAEQELVITVQFSVGNAKIVSAKGEKAAAPGEVVSFEDSIVTGPSSVIDLNFGTMGVVRIVENSSVKIAELEASPGNKQVRFDMKKGKIFVVLAKLPKGTSLSVNTRTTIAAIRGTSFMIVSDPTTSKISVLKGKILVQLAKEGKLAPGIEKMLEANKKVVVSEDLANEIIAGKKQMEVVALSPKEISDIKKEIKDIKISDKLDPEAQKEFTDLTRDSETGKEGKPGPVKKQDAPKEMQSIPSL